jgi:hypothetical protein
MLMFFRSVCPVAELFKYSFLFRCHAHHDLPHDTLFSTLFRAEPVCFKVPSSPSTPLLIYDCVGFRFAVRRCKALARQSFVFGMLEIWMAQTMNGYRCLLPASASHGAGEGLQPLLTSRLSGTDWQLASSFTQMISALCFAVLK